MPESRLDRIRRWHPRRVLSILPIRLENYTSGWYFLRRLEGRWSASRKRWLWRPVRALHAPTTNLTSR